MLTKQELIDFEQDISEIYKTGKIKGPIHLRGGNEECLIHIFKDIKPEDYVFATWTNHLEALLKGIPKEKIKEKILAGESMAMNFPEYNFYTSAIVGGIGPIATGVAWAIKEKKENRLIHCFIGDMTLLAGVISECIRYSINFDLPIHWIIGDNNKSVDTQTDLCWGQDVRKDYFRYRKEIEDNRYNNVAISYYSYVNKWPHSGVGSFVSF